MAAAIVAPSTAGAETDARCPTRLGTEAAPITCSPAEGDGIQADRLVPEPNLTRITRRGKHPAGERYTTASYYEGAVGTFGELKGNYAASKWWAGHTRLLVCTKRGGNNCVHVRILDRCQCGLDLRRSVFARLFGGTSQGTGRVWMERA